MPTRARRQFTEEFKAEAVNLVRQSGKTIAQVARDLDLTDSALRNWVERSQHAGSPSSELSSAEYKELQQLRKEVRVLRMERELLKNPPEGLRSVEPETPRRAMAASVQKERPSAFW